MIGGLFVALGVAAWHPTAWLIPFSAATCFAAFGAWGIADRELGERLNGPEHSLVGVLRATRVASAATGALAAVTLFLAVLAMALGTWIS